MSYYLTKLYVTWILFKCDIFRLLELNHPEVTQKVRKEIVPIKDSLRKMDFKGAQNLLNKLK